MREQTDISGEFLRTLGNAGEHGKHEIIGFSRICLSADGISAAEAELLRYLALQRFDLFLVALKKLEKTCTRAGGSSATEQLHVTEDKIEMLKIEHEILHPERRSLAHRGRLSRLKMRICQRFE